MLKRLLVFVAIVLVVTVAVPIVAQEDAAETAVQFIELAVRLHQTIVTFLINPGC